MMIWSTFCVVLAVVTTCGLAHGEHIDEHNDEHIQESHDVIVDYAAHPTTVTRADGNWFDPTIWSAGVPDADDKFRVDHHVTIAPLPQPAATPAKAEAVALDGKVKHGGQLTMAAGSSLAVRTLHIFGELDQRAGGELVLRDRPIDAQFDPQQTGHGLLLHDGAIWVARKAKFHSENPSGVRGHIIALGRAYVDVEGSEFYDLGRTTIDQLDNTHLTADRQVKHVGKNQVGRYTLHLHHTFGPKGLPDDQPQFRIVGNTFRNGRKWAVVVHDSHYGVVTNNTIDGFDGAGISFEDGSEYGNTVAFNTITNIRGSGQGVQGRGNGQEPKLVYDPKHDPPYYTLGDHGHEGAGIWGRGVANNITDNVVSNAVLGCVFWCRFQPEDKVPLFKGASTVTNYRLVEHGQQLGHVFERNNFSACRTAAHLQGLYENVRGGSFVATDCTFDCPTGLDASYSAGIRLAGGRYRCTRSFGSLLGYTNRIQLEGVKVTSPVGVDISNSGHVKDSTFTGRIGVLVEYERTTTYQREIPLTNVKGNIGYRLGDWFNIRCYTAPLDVIVRDHNGVAGDDFQLWFAHQRPGYVFPATNESNRSSRLSPEAGLTNQQLWDKYKLCLGGRLLPADAKTRERIEGYITPILSDREGPQILDLTVEATANSAKVSLKTNEPAWSQVEWSGRDISIEKYANMMPATKTLATEHTHEIEGLTAGKEYQFLVRVVDQLGNLGGDVELGGLHYITRKFTTER